MTIKLDKKDWRIIYELCENSRISRTQLARKLSMNKNTVEYRIQRLLKIGIIKSFFMSVNLYSLGYYNYNLLIKVKKDSREFIDFLVNSPHTLVVEPFVGEWHLLVEIAVKKNEEMYELIEKMKEKFSDIIDNYELHPTLYSIKLEQLPFEIPDIGKPQKIEFENKKRDYDEKDMDILKELTCDSTMSFVDLGNKLDMTYETVSLRVKRMIKEGIIQKFSSQIMFYLLGYEFYFVMVTLRHLSSERESAFRRYISSSNNIRYAFVSASEQKVFMYYLSKNAEDLNVFLQNMNNEFYDIIFSQTFLVSTGLYKYKLLPVSDK